MVKQFAVIFLVCLAAVHAVQIRTRKEANAYLDAILKEGYNDTSRDSVGLEDIDVEINKDLIISFVGRANLTNGTLSGINNADRKGPSKVTVNNDTTTVLASIRYDSLTAVYQNAQIILNDDDFNGKLIVKYKNLNAAAILRVDDNTGVVKLEKFALRGAKREKLSLVGSGSIRAFKAIPALEDVQETIRGFVGDSLEERLRELVQGRQ